MPLELGGAVNDARNLWSEPGASPNPKDAVEDGLNEKVCDGQMTLGRAQRAITANWVALAPHPSTHVRSNDTSTAPSGPSAAGATCAVSASYNTRYHDYDVYVHSNRPHETVTVTAGLGRTATWHTDAGGYADLYFHSPADAAGEAITAHVGGASCHTTLLPRLRCLQVCDGVNERHHSQLTGQHSDRDRSGRSHPSRGARRSDAVDHADRA